MALLLNIQKEPDNDVADVLIRILLIYSNKIERKITREKLAEIYCVNKLYGGILPLTYQIIDQYQQKEK